MEMERTTNGHFVYRLIPPRPTFDEDMTDAERAIMGRHAEYWAGVMPVTSSAAERPERRSNLKHRWTRWHSNTI